MNDLQIPETLTAQVPAAPDPDTRLGAYMGYLIRDAAAMTDVNGEQKAVAVREGIKTVLFGDDGLTNEREWLDDLIALDGIAEWLSDRAIGLATRDGVVNRIIDALVKVAYDALKGAGVAL